MPKSDAARLRAARKALHWPRPTVAAMLGIAPYTLFAYERGDRTTPPAIADWLETLAKELAVILRHHPPPQL